MIKTAAIFGTGAVGSYFLWGLSEKMGKNLFGVANGERKARYERDGFWINDVHFQPEIRTPEQVRGVDLLLIAAKYDSLRESLDDIAQIVTDDTIVISLLNGVDSEEIVGNRIGVEHMLYSMMRIASERKGNRVLFNPEETPGIYYGERDGRTDSAHIRDVAELFDGTQVKYHIRENIMQELWYKMAFNVSYNLPQAIVGCQVGAFAVSKHMTNLRMQLRAEVCAIAAAIGVDIGELSALEKLKHPSHPASKFSTLQDLEAGRHTEIDMFAGTLIRLGEEHGVETPYLRFCYDVIHALEEKNDGRFDFGVRP